MGLLSALTSTLALSAALAGLAQADQCGNSAEAAALRARAATRRADKANALREKRGLQPVDGPSHHLYGRDGPSLARYEAESHDLTSTDHYNISTNPSEIFSSANNGTCAKAPETTVGAYYVIGEILRTNLTEGQAGVPVHLDLQFVDAATCGPVSDLVIDIWLCNATGSYSGLDGSGQGGLASTYSRGLQQTDQDGVVTFDIVYPGHAADRANHIGVIATSGATAVSNGTFAGGTARHVGQFFFDSNLTAEVEATDPYTTNSQQRMLLSKDKVAGDAASADYDPLLDYVRLGSDLSDGLLMWITVAIDTAADRTGAVIPAAHYYEGGGIAVADNSTVPTEDSPPVDSGSSTVSSTTTTTSTGTDSTTTTSISTSVSTTTKTTITESPTEPGQSPTNTSPDHSTSSGGAARLRILGW